MGYYQQREKPKRKLYQSPLFLLGMLVLAVLLVNSSLHFYGAYRDTLTKRNEAEAKYNELVDRKTQMDAELRNVDTPEGTERILREKYRVGKEGEGVVVITDPEPEEVALSKHKNRIVLFFERLFGVAK